MPGKRKIVTTSPENSETPLETLTSWVTPTRLFFVRNHFDVPRIDADAWCLRIHGCVEKPTTLDLEHLTALPQRSVFATVECAGNGRSFLRKPVAGVQWGAGAIGHAEWTGVPVRTVLEEARMRPEAVEVVFEGADMGTESDHPEPMHFARSLPLDKALHPDTLLALRMNGELLDPNHGFPLRLFVPGWYGVAAVKWLTRIEVVDQPFRGYFQTTKYTIQRQSPQGRETVVVGTMAIKSEIIHPRSDEKLGLGTNRIFGIACAGEEEVAGVEVSTDGGRTWSEAELIGSRGKYAWCLWEYLWQVAEPGSYDLLARARSDSGKTQTVEHNPLRGGYMINFSRPRQVEVATERRGEDRPGDVEALLYDMDVFAEENIRHPLDVDLEYADGAGI